MEEEVSSHGVKLRSVQTWQRVGMRATAVEREAAAEVSKQAAVAAAVEVAVAEAVTGT